MLLRGLWVELMAPRETSADILARAFALLVEGVEAKVRESLPTPADEWMTSADVRGYSTQSVAKWCRDGAIEGATRLGRRGHWRFRRSAFDAFLRGGRRRRLSLVA